MKASIKRTANELLAQLRKRGMTRRTVHGDPGEEFIVRGHNEVTETDQDKIVFYKDVTKVHVVPERTTFTIQVIIRPSAQR